MTRFLDRTWRPLFRVLLGLVVVLATYGGVVQQQAVRSLARATERNEATIAALRRQVRSLGGNPDAPVVVVSVRPQGPAPAASPTTRTEQPEPTAVKITRTPKPVSPTPSRTCDLVDDLLGACR